MQISDMELLRKSCLVVTDSDLIIRSYTSIDQISIEMIKSSLEDVPMANMVLYDGILGQKVLKLRMSKICRNGIGGYHAYRS